MKTLVFFLGVSLLASCAKEVPSNKLVERAGVTYEVNSATPYSGRSVEYYVQRVDDEAPQQLKEARNYQDGRPHGVWESFYVSGQSESTGSWINGARDGIWTTFHPNGQIYLRGNYVNNLEDGSWESFGRDGENQETTKYMSGLLVLRSDDVVYYELQPDFKAGTYRVGSTKPYTGIVETYYEDSRELLHWRERIKDGLLDGVTEGFHENGQLAEETIYQNDEQVGTTTFYDASGALREGFEESHVSGRLYRYNYKNGKRDGISEQYREDGQLESRVSYKNGIEDGPNEHYEDTGELTRNWNYKEGQRHGIQEDYYQGQLKSTSTYEEGTLQEIVDHLSVIRGDGLEIKLVDEATEYLSYRAGTTTPYTGLVEIYYEHRPELLQWRTRYKDGLEDGVAERFHENGQLAEETIYQEGEPVGTATFYDPTGALNEGVEDFLLRGLRHRNHYKNGKQDGLREMYLEGQLVERYRYKDGKQHGIQERFWEGQLTSKSNYKEGKEHGVSDSFYKGEVQLRYFYENDVIQKVEQHHEGKLFGTTPFYDGEAGPTVYEHDK